MKLDLSKRKRAVITSQSEVSRVLALPEKSPIQNWERSEVLKRCVRPGAKLSLREVQIEMLVNAGRRQGGLFGVGVGHGKTLVSLLISHVIMCKNPTLIVPSKKVLEKTLIEALEYDESFFIDERIEILTYGELSSAHGEDLLNFGRAYVDAKKEGIDPSPFIRVTDLLICDEAHLVSDPTSARTGRVKRFIKEYEPRFVAMTGTLVKKSIKDYAHLSAWSLGEYSPLPRRYGDLESWALCIDNPTSFSWPMVSDWQKIRGLVNKYVDLPKKFMEYDAEERRAYSREAYQQRIRSIDGVVLTSDLSCDRDLLLYRFQIEQSIEIKEALKTLAQTWQRPDGEYIKTGLEMSAIARQLALGFYYYWDWPNGIKDKEWLSARRNWSKEIRRVTKRPRPRRDTPALVVGDINRGGFFSHDRELCDALEEWRRVKDRPKPPTRAAWICTKAIDRIIAKAFRVGEGVLWYIDSAVGDYLEEHGGIEVYRAGSAPPLKKKEGVIYALSIRSHGTGHNLQAHNTGFVVGCPPSASVNEQMIGRFHRANQKRDVSFYYLTDGAGPLEASMNDAIMGAYRLTTENDRQRLLSGKWEIKLDTPKKPGIVDSHPSEGARK